ncbi:MAG: VWA domain-containing protein [Defluviitaleaceae bacterium]|nr:VWA domain-containing protein [Defluviitaleaceae bacterium]
MKHLIKMMLIMLLAVMSVMPTVARAEVADEGADLMIVIDKSTSMGEHDPHIEVLAATEQLLHLSLGTANRVGFVVYNHEILAYQSLERMTTLDQIDAIMTQLRGLLISGWTDVGLALQTARQQLEQDGYRLGRTAMIFLSDGDYTLDDGHPVPNRTQADVMADVEAVLTTISYPIFNIQYSVLLYLDLAPKNEWGPRTGGVNLNATTPGEMTAAVNQVYRLIMEMVDENEPLPTEPILYEHQLIIDIPQTVDEADEVIVEVTLIGEGLVESIIIPDAYDHITIRPVGTHYVITVTNPQQDVYVLSYLAFSEEALEVRLTRHLINIPAIIRALNPIALGVSILLTVGILVLLVSRIRKKRIIKKAYPTLKSKLECYFMELPTGTKPIPIQSWSATVLAAHPQTSLYQLLKNMPIRMKMTAAKNIFISIQADNSFLITHQADIVCYKDGRAISDQKITLKSGQGLYVVFHKGTLEIELRAK